MLKLVFSLLLIVATLPAQNNWRCVFNPSLCGGPTEPPERFELCDQKVPDGFQLVYGPPPIGPGCISVPEKVEYYSKVKTWVIDSESLFEGEAAESFKENGFGNGLRFKRSWGSYERELIGFPRPEWGVAVVVGDASYVDKYPFPFIAAGQTDAIRQGACVAEVAAQVPPKVKLQNVENCK